MCAGARNGFVESSTIASQVLHFAGPPGMTMAMQSMLEGLGVDENDMHSEEFYGY
jgi:ferredoxin-NADP reductase